MGTAARPKAEAFSPQAKVRDVSGKRTKEETSAFPRQSVPSRHGMEERPSSLGERVGRRGQVATLSTRGRLNSSVPGEEAWKPEASGRAPLSCSLSQWKRVGERLVAPALSSYLLTITYQPSHLTPGPHSSPLKPQVPCPKPAYIA